MDDPHAAQAAPLAVVDELGPGLARGITAQAVQVQLRLHAQWPGAAGGTTSRLRPSAEGQGLVGVELKSSMSISSDSACSSKLAALVRLAVPGSGAGCSRSCSTRGHKFLRKGVTPGPTDSSNSRRSWSASRGGGFALFTRPLDGDGGSGLVRAPSAAGRPGPTRCHSSPRSAIERPTWSCPTMKWSTTRIPAAPARAPGSG